MRCEITSSRFFRVGRDWNRRLPRPLVPRFQNESSCKLPRENESDLPGNKAVGWTLPYECFARSLVLMQRQKAVRSSLLVWILSSHLKNFVQIFSCIVPFLFQGKGNSGVKAVKDDKGTSNSSADYENHSSANCAEQQIDSFDELNLEEKQGSHWS